MDFSRRTVVSRMFTAAGVTGVLGALSACGAPGTAGGDKPATTSAPVTVRWVNDVGTPTADAFNAEIIKRLNGKYGGKIDVQVEAFPDPDWAKRYEKYTAMALSNTMPEIIWLCCTYIRPFMLAGLAANLDGYIKKDWKQGDVDDFFKGPYEAFQVEKKQYALPVYLNTNIMFVNKNHLREAGLAYPDESWDRNKFLEYCTKLFRKGERWAFDMSFAGADRNVSWIWSNGGEPHDPKDGPAVTKLLYDSPKTVEAIQFLHDLLWKQQVSPRSNDDRGGLGRNDAFLAGKTAIILDAASSTGQDIFNKAPAANLDWDFLPLVKGPNGHGARISTDGYMLDKGTKIGDQAWTVLRELASAESGTVRAQLNRQQPPRKSVATAFEKAYEGKTAKLARVMADTGRADPRAFWKEASQVEPIVGKHMNATLTRNEVPVPVAMKALMDEVRGFYGAK